MFSRITLAGLMLCVFSGCHSCGPRCNSCGPNMGYPQSQIYTTPQMVVPNSVQPGVPSGGVPANGGSNAAPYQAPVTNPPNTGGEKAVPDYGDPPTEIDPNYNVPVEPVGANERPNDFQLSSSETSELAFEEEDGFFEPITAQPASSISDVDKRRPNAVSSRPDPYMYDNDADDFNGDGVEETYEWLRGVVDYDAKRSEWQITYNSDPTDKDDKYGGTFTLSNVQGLYDLGLIPDDVVLIDGHVDIENVNYQGKPTYRIENVKRLKPD
jgi:hypothetical protein